MRLFIMCLCLLPLASFAQRDYDYAFYTQNARTTLPASIGKGTMDTITLSWPRRITKEGSTLKITSVINSADELVCHLEFYGCDMTSNCGTLIYKSGDKFIRINPSIPTVDINSEIFYYY